MSIKIPVKSNRIVKSELTLDDAFPPGIVEALLETIIDQNEETIALLRKIVGRISSTEKSTP